MRQFQVTTLRKYTYLFCTGARGVNAHLEEMSQKHSNLYTQCMWIEYRDMMNKTREAACLPNPVAIPRAYWAHSSHVFVRPDLHCIVQQRYKPVMHQQRQEKIDKHNVHNGHTFTQWIQPLNISTSFLDRENCLPHDSGLCSCCLDLRF